MAAGIGVRARLAAMFLMCGAGGVAFGACSSATVERVGPTSTSIASQRGTTSTTNAPITTTTLSSEGVCPGALSVSLSADKQRYRLVDTVTVAVRIRNVSQHPCTIPDPYPSPFGSQFTLFDSARNAIYPTEHRVNGVFIRGLRVAPQPLVLEAGRDYGYTVYRWDLHFCRQQFCGVHGERLVSPGAYVLRSSKLPDGQTHDISIVVVR